MSRLRHSASLLGYTIPTLPALAMQVAQQIALARQTHHAPVNAWRVRLLLGEQGSTQVTAAVLDPLAPQPKVALSLSTLDSQEFWLQHKSTHRPWYEQATSWLARHPEYFDVLFLNERGEICEGSRSNVYVYRNGQWLTPPRAAGLLPGVWRTRLLQQGDVREAVLRGEDLQDSTRLRLSNGLRGWFDVQLDLHTQVA